MLQLRPYQLAAQNAVYEHLRTRDDNPCVCLPTGSGKSPLMAAICKDAVTVWSGRVLILAHVKELLEQTADKLQQVCPEVAFGIYCAGLNRRETQEAVIIASIQSIWKKAEEFEPFDLVLIDECHLCGTEEDGMYVSFLADMKRKNPHVRVIGFTATPYRLKSGPLCTPEGLLNHICYEVGIRELIDGGYLCPLISKAGKTKVDTSTLHVRCGEFASNEAELLMDDNVVVAGACREIVELTRDRRAVLLFASGIYHGQHLVRVLQCEHDIECGFITGETPSVKREQLIARFKSGDLKYLCNVNVLTTGFDSPHIDCVTLLRPTMSPGLLYQSVGRGLRVHPDKKNCLVLDFAGNILRLGPIDQLRIKERSFGSGQAPVKECPECQALIAAGYSRCPECGYEFPAKQKVKHETQASEAGVLSGQVTITTYPVEDIYYRVHRKAGASEDTPRTLNVIYKVGWKIFKQEFVCLEHTGYARQKAVAWWRKRSPDPAPETAQQAVDIAHLGGVAVTKSITVRQVAGDKYETIIGHELGPIPESVEVSSDEFYDPLAEVPF